MTVAKIIESLTAKTESDEVQWLRGIEQGNPCFQFTYKDSHFACQTDEPWLQIDGTKIDMSQAEDRRRVKMLAIAVHMQDIRRITGVS